ncbi:MAG: phage holin family protein [Synergistaceae bacterium]|nr:phage holin family protein [Synergistaceae bacterium]MBR0252723.1 phage holin family protein [Synergistaceae bacterium]
MNDELSEFFIAGFVGILGWFFGGLDGFTQVLIACTVVDYITGVCKAGVEHKISSSVAFTGIARKIVMFFLVGVAHIIDKHMLGDTAALRTAVCLFYIGNEGISIVENAEKLGVPIPKFLHGKFLSFTEENQKEEKLLSGKKNVKPKVRETSN